MDLLSNEPPSHEIKKKGKAKYHRLPEPTIIDLFSLGFL